MSKETRSLAAKRGWITRRENQRRRSAAAKRGWVTRRKNQRSAAAKRGWVTRRKNQAFLEEDFDFGEDEDVSP